MSIWSGYVCVLILIDSKRYQVLYFAENRRILHWR